MTVCEPCTAATDFLQWSDFCSLAAQAEGGSETLAVGIALLMAEERLARAQTIQLPNEVVYWEELLQHAERAHDNEFLKIAARVRAEEYVYSTVDLQPDSSLVNQQYWDERTTTRCAEYLHSVNAFPPNCKSFSDLPYTTTVLDLSNRGITSLPPELACLVRLRRLNISGNPLGTLSDVVWWLPRLRWLEANRCELTAFSPYGPAAETLAWVGINGNPISSMPWRLMRCFGLQGASLPKKIEKISNDLATFLPDFKSSAGAAKETRSTLRKQIHRLHDARTMITIADSSPAFASPESMTISLEDVATYMVHDARYRYYDCNSVGLYTSEPAQPVEVRFECADGLESMCFDVERGVDAHKNGSARWSAYGYYGPNDAMGLEWLQADPSFGRIFVTAMTVFFSDMDGASARLPASRRNPFIFSGLAIEECVFGYRLLYQSHASEIEQSYFDARCDGGESGSTFYVPKNSVVPQKIDEVQLRYDAIAANIDVNSMEQVMAYLHLRFPDVES